ncbi:MAG: zinc ribbon domain-containing protein [Pseudomonadota bacterium]
MSFGILAVGRYVPRYRLSASVVADALGWFQPALKAAREQSRSFAHWDEDALTMAVEAARDGLGTVDVSDVSRIVLASTTLPFADRSNVGVVREALDIVDSATVCESSGSMRAGSTALDDALSAQRAGKQLVIASDCVDTQPASADEVSHGHGAAAVVVGDGEPIATLTGRASLHQDFVDHYRAAGERFSYVLEARWTRDAGYRDQVLGTYRLALDEAGLKDVDHLAVAAPLALQRAIVKQVGGKNGGLGFAESVGYCGAAQALLMLVDALSQAKRGDTIALITIGQGVDVSVFELQADPAPIADLPVTNEDNYTRYLSMRRLLNKDEGIRAERDNRTAQSAAWRSHQAVTGFKGGRCSACNTLQFPASEVCVRCGATGTQSLHRLADMTGTVRSYTEDWLAYTPRPPLVFGNVGFTDGANVMMEFTDIEAGQLAVGDEVRMQFRIKDFDDRRGFRRYFWKPTPIGERADG